MKVAIKYKRILAILFFSGWVCSAFSQSYLGGTAGIHVPFTLDQSDFSHIKPSYGGDIGLVYEWHKGHFLLHTGIQYAIDCPIIGIDSMAMEQSMIDTRGVPFTYRWNLKDRTDQIIAGQLSIPIYIGGEWHGFYAMGGVSAIINLHTTSRQKALRRTAGDYIDRYYEWFTNMPNHGYYDYEPVQTNKAVAIRPFDIHAGIELGYSFRINRGHDKKPPVLRIGVFAEGDVLEWFGKTSDQPLIQPDFLEYMDVDMTHFYASAEGATSKPHLLMAGIRLTILAPLAASKVSKRRNSNCRCYGTYGYY